MVEKSGRIDIIEQGNSINFEIIENKENFQIRPISWFQNKTGIVLDEINPINFFVMKANNNINLRFNLKGVDRRTIDNKFIEEWCTFTSFRIRGKEMLSKPVKVWHNQGFDIDYTLSKGESVKIEYQYETEIQELIHLISDKKNLKYKLGKILWENKGIKILTQQETIEEIIRKKLSVARFGDGEIRWMLVKGYCAKFQKYDEHLAQRLREVLNAKNTNILVCLAGQYNLNIQRSQFWETCIQETILDLSQTIETNKIFGDTNITRNANNVPQMKQIWQDKDIVIVEGDKSRLGIGNDLFDNVKSLKRILCPAPVP